MEIDKLVWNWQPYTPLGIAQMAEKVPGVYFIANHNCEAIYIGQAEDIAERVGDHIEGRSDQAERIKQYSPVRFCCWRVGGGEKARRQVEATLTQHYSPLAGR